MIEMLKYFTAFTNVFESNVKAYKKNPNIKKFPK